MKVSLYSAVLGALFLASCGSEPKTEEKVDVVETSVQDVEVQSEEEFILPSTVQIGDLFRNSGLEYVDGLALDPQRASNYNTTFDKYFAFGAYWTDMTYCVLNQKSQEARAYMKVIKQLSSDLGAGEMYSDEVLLGRFDKNLDNNDSILMILIEIDERTDMYIDDNDQQEFAMVAFVAGWVEGMYLGVSTSDLESHTLMTGRIIEQMVILDNLIKGMNNYKGTDAKLDKVLSKMEDLYNFYINIPAIKNVEGSISDVQIPTTDMQLLGNKIIDLRKIIVE